MVFVVADHGFTFGEFSNHGEDSELETSTPIFGYAKQGFIKREQKDIGQIMDQEFLSAPAIYQLNVPPTYCMLMGIPIPSNNLGMIIPDFFINKPDIVDDFVIANNFYTNLR